MAAFMAQCIGSCFISGVLSVLLKHSEGKCDKPEIHTTEETVDSMKPTYFLNEKFKAVTAECESDILKFH